jgi:cathepsin D
MTGLTRIHPAQSFNLYLDTGSADLWVIGTTCTGQFKSYCSQVPVFDSSKSSSFAGSQQRETISYLDGTGFTGDLSNDTVSFAGFQLENVPVSTLGIFVRAWL